MFTRAQIIKQELMEFCKRNHVFIEGVIVFDDPSGKTVVDLRHQMISADKID